MLKKRTIVLILLSIVGLVLALGFYLLVCAISLRSPSAYVVGLWIGGLLGVLYSLALSAQKVSVAVVIEEGETLILVKQTEGGEWGLPGWPRRDW